MSAPRTLKKADPDALLGPPHNARLWQQARAMVAMSNPNPSYNDILQVYQLLSLAPGFQAAHAFGKGDWHPPAGVREACRRGLAARDEHGGDGLTSEAVRWAGKMARGEPVSPDKAKAMHAFFSRHKVDRKPGWGVGKPTPGWVAWQLWGGDAGQAWARKLRRQADDEDTVQKGKDRLRKKRRGALFGNGAGLWRWAKKEAERRGKPQAYAAAIANRVMGKALTFDSGYGIGTEWDALGRTQAGFRDNNSLRLQNMVPAMMEAMSPTPLPPPSKTVDKVSAALADIEMDEALRPIAEQAIATILRQSESPKQAAGLAGQVLQAIPNTSGAQRREIGLRIAFLHSLGLGAFDA